MNILDLKSYAKSQARLDNTNYHESPDGLRQDRNLIRRAQAAAKKAAGFSWNTDYHLMPGTYSDGRLIITESSIDYCPGQYAPTEIWWAVEDYFLRMRRLEEMVNNRGLYLMCKEEALANLKYWPDIDQAKGMDLTTHSYWLGREGKGILKGLNSFNETEEYLWAAIHSKLISRPPKTS